MKPFNIKEYNDNPSRKVVTRDGRPVRILCTNARRTYPVVALIEDKDNEEDLLYAYLPDGTMCSMLKQNDLFFKPIKREGWTNLYRRNDGKITIGYFHYTKEDALTEVSGDSLHKRIATIKLEWEE